MKKTKVRPRRMLLDRMVEIDAHCTALQNLCKNQREAGTERNGNNGPRTSFRTGNLMTTMTDYITTANTESDCGRINIWQTLYKHLKLLDCNLKPFSFKYHSLCSHNVQNTMPLSWPWHFSYSNLKARSRPCLRKSSYYSTILKWLNKYRRRILLVSYSSVFSQKMQYYL